MDLLGIVQSVFYEAKLTGDAPTGTAGLVGREADLVRWAIEAYNDIQRENDGRWKWLRGDWYLDTVADTASYVSTASVYDNTTAALITRFRAWEMDEREPPLIYLSADGKVTERTLLVDNWQNFRHQYVRATHTSAYPGDIAVKYDDKLFLGPTPDAVYRVTGSYWKSNQTLAVDGDTPEMPSDYHMAIVYRSIVKYGYDSVSPEILARAEAEGTPIWNALENNQPWSRYSITTAGALA
ncbi:MAG: hypothetical protein E4H01_00525 [Lysobacterales bacterium]|nr:MAG: hypothetical protein E4H01_00525 [Xanthomonadales bacterium]